MKMWILLGLLMLATATWLRAESVCGDEHVTCGQDEKCCEHIVAMFSSAGAVAPPYVVGQCIPKEQRCGEYWCGNRHCQAGFFGSPSVCCVTNNSGGEPAYRCAYSELSCPGNTEQLTIRDRIASRPLQRG